MASTLNKIGQSLLKYFKPVRTTPVHRVPKEFAVLVQKRTASDSNAQGSFSEQQEKLKKQFKAFQPEKSEQLLSETVFGPADQKAQGNWVDLVVYLVGACRKVAEKLRQKGGVQFYKQTVQQQSARKIRTLGAIVDTTTDDISDKKTTKRINNAA